MTEYNNADYVYNIKIKNISITNIKLYNSNDGDERIAKMCTMEIPYNTNIIVSEIEDY
ncbi:MAG: hypothetical protein HDR71_17965 [Lachnospiraceae bacterium]|nr:hypothetical protein [Lachnospiraceae bacterium]